MGEYPPKKGTCLSILLLTAIIVSAAVSIFSLDQSFNKDMQTAWSKADAPDVSSYLIESRVTPELLEQVEAFPQTERVACHRGLISSDNQIGDSRTENVYFYIGMPPDTLLFREDFSGLEPAPPLAPGEIYVPYGLAQYTNCRIGDTLTATFGRRTYSFRIRALSRNLPWAHLQSVSSYCLSAIRIWKHTVLRRWRMSRQIRSSTLQAACWASTKRRTAICPTRYFCGS